MLAAGCGETKSTPPAPPPLAASSSTPAPPPLPKASASSGFEGELELVARSADTKKPMPPIKLMVKGAKLRVDLPEELPRPPMLGQRVHVVLNAPERKLFAVLEDKRQVVLVNLDNMQKDLEGLQPPGNAGARAKAKQTPPKVTRTGHTDTVAGRTCEDWDLVTPEGQKTRVCVAEEEVAWFSLPDLALPPEQAWAGQFLDGKHFPLRFISFDKKGGESGRVEVSKLEKKPIDDALLAVPGDYQTTDVASLIGGFMAGMLGAPAQADPAAGGLPGMPAGAKMTPQMAEMIKQMQARMRAQQKAQK
jgi:hypothetical protein